MPIAVSRRRNDTTNVTTVAQNTESAGEKPQIMKPMIATSEMKWYQYRRVSVPSEVSSAIATAGRPNFRVSNSTIRNSDR